MLTRIVFEDKSIIVCYKPAGIATQTAMIGQKDMVSELKNYLSETNIKTKGEPYLGLIHRLDQPVEGLLVFAKEPEAAKELSEQMARHTAMKYYYALIYGKDIPNEATYVDEMVKDHKTNKSKIIESKTKDSKEAKLSYQIVERVADMAIADVKLYTGRHHQIRLQMAHAGFPILGDNKYGTPESIRISRERDVHTVALCAYKLEFRHPLSKEKLVFTIRPENKCFEIWKGGRERESAR
jgi:23S rRNA pseudouridine1911/1915/1917 synthase